MKCLFKFSMLTNSKISNVFYNLQQATDLAVKQRNIHLFINKNQHVRELENLNTVVENSRVTLIEVIHDTNCFL